MNNQKYIKLEFRLVELLQTKMNLLQPQDEREALVEGTLNHLFSRGEFADLKSAFDDITFRIQFLKNFLSYGIITDLLCDIDVEDLIINNLNPIYIHHSKEGFRVTGKAFTSHQ